MGSRLSCLETAPPSIPMTTALLKFQRAEDMPPQQPLALSVFTAALDNFPEPLAICENSAVLYANHRFADICGPVSNILENGASPVQWQTADFQADHADSRCACRDTKRPFPDLSTLHSWAVWWEASRTTSRLRQSC